MAIKSPSLLWNIGQDLGKSDKEQARSNAGIESIKNASRETNKFLTHIAENSTSGNLEAKYAQPVIADVSGLSTALTNLKTFYATKSTTFNELLTAYNNGQTLLLRADYDSSLGGSYKDYIFTLGWISKSSSTIDAFEFIAIEHFATTEGNTPKFTKSIRVASWTCRSGTNWDANPHINWVELATTEYADYNVSPTFQQSDVTVATGDKLLISDASDNGKEVRSDIGFDTTASDLLFLSKKGSWESALPVYTETGSSLSGNYWDSLTDTKFRIIKASPTPTSNNTSPEGGNMFALTGFYDRGNNKNYTVQLAMGDKMYYRHSENDGAEWSDWITVGREYSAGTDLKLSNGVFSVDTASTIGDNCLCSFVLGQSNLIKDSDNSVLGGYANNITGMNYSLAFGYNNTVGVASSTVYETFGHGNILFGVNNLVQRGDNNYVIGINNTISVPVIPSESADYPLRNIMIGEFNSIGNNASGVYGHDTILIGRGLSWSEPSYSPLVLGVFNSDDWRYKSDGYIPLRITGGGSNDSNRKNVEVVYTNGLVWSDSGFEVSDVYANGSSTYSARLYKTMDTTTSDINGAGMWSRWTHRDRMSGNQVLDYSETAHVTNLTISLVASKFDSDAVAFDNEKGLVNMNAVSQILLKRTPPEQLGPSDKTYSAVLEFSSTSAGGNVGLTMGSPALPSWNVREAASSSDIALTWLQIYANRNASGDAGGDILPSDNSVPLGNLEVGKIAVRFYKVSELTETNPLIPGQKVGDISFIVGDPSATDQGFYVYDYYSSGIGVPATPQIHRINSYISTGYQFCMLMTVEPSVFDRVTHMFVTPGSFSALYC